MKKAYQMNHALSIHPIGSPSLRKRSGTNSPPEPSSSGFFERYARRISGFFRGRAAIRQIFFTLCSTKHGHGHARLVKTCYDMNLSPLIRIRNTVLACGVASAWPLLGFGQTVFLTMGGQFSITVP